MTTTDTIPREATLPDVVEHAARHVGVDPGELLLALLAEVGSPGNYGCPAWCVRKDHEADVVGPDDPPIHYGPDFGDIGMRCRGDGVAYAELYEPGVRHEFTPVELRKLAREALAAARWLDGPTWGEGDDE